MSSPQLSFKRYEKKYLLDPGQYDRLRAALMPYILPGEYPQSTILSLYYDTEDFSLIRTSLEQPVYKEKLRLRAYGVPGPDDPVFVELKKKYDGVVYKRRIRLPLHLARDYLSGTYHPSDGQVVRELDFFLARYKLSPAALLCYDREALTAKDDPGVRVTFDRNIRARNVQIDPSKGDWGAPVLSPELVLMELKVPAAVPLWLAHLLSEEQIRPAHFSKYGACYQQYLAPGAKLKSIQKDVFHCA